MQCTPVTVGRGRGRSRRWGRHGQRSGGGTNEGRGDGNTKAVDGIFPAKGCFTCDKKGQRVADYAEKLCRRCNGWGHAADVCSTAKEETASGGEQGGIERRRRCTWYGPGFSFQGQRGRRVLQCRKRNGRRRVGIAGRRQGLGFRQWRVYSHDALCRQHGEAPKT